MCLFDMRTEKLENKLNSWLCYVTEGPLGPVHFLLKTRGVNVFFAVCSNPLTVTDGWRGAGFERGARGLFSLKDFSAKGKYF